MCDRVRGNVLSKLLLAALFVFVTVQANSANAQGDGKLNDLSFDDLTFEMEKEERFDRSMLTDEIVGYHKTTVRLRGFIRPTMRQDNISKFIFVRDNKECCFGPGAALYDCVLVQLEEGLTTEYTVRPITIKGEFYLREYEGPDGKVWAIYRLRNAVVE